MDKTYTVKITDQAQGQMQDTVHYIAGTLKAPEAAFNLLVELEENIISLDDFPQRVALVSEEPWRSYGVRCLPVKNYLVYFWIDEINKKVQITAVLYEKRDQIRQLSQMIME